MGHPVREDEERKLWACELPAIEMDLALERYRKTLPQYGIRVWIKANVCHLRKLAKRTPP